MPGPYINVERFDKNSMIETENMDTKYLKANGSIADTSFSS